MRNLLYLLLLLLSANVMAQSSKQEPKMKFGDTSRLGRPFSKDPHVVNFKGKYLMYCSTPPNDKFKGWGIGIAESNDLTNWKPIDHIAAEYDYEAKGLCAPGALVRNDTVHLFYQTYGNWEKDAICHAWSVDGVHFQKNATNPIFRPQGSWTVGRAIDAEVGLFKGKFYLYFATRDTTMTTQMQGVAVAKGQSFDRDQWIQQGDGPVLAPKYPWEGECVEGASVIARGDEMYMFYAGAYNNQPQQVGVAKSKDGVHWARLSNKPFLENGDPGSWNSSESGHPHIFKDNDGKTYLFFQGNNDNGHTWMISKKEVLWNADGPYFKDNDCPK